MQSTDGVARTAVFRSPQSTPVRAPGSRRVPDPTQSYRVPTGPGPRGVPDMQRSLYGSHVMLTSQIARGGCAETFGEFSSGGRAVVSAGHGTLPACQLFGRRKTLVPTGSEDLQRPRHLRIDAMQDLKPLLEREQPDKG
jgi:hypothetical protein